MQPNFLKLDTCMINLDNVTSITKMKREGSETTYLGVKFAAGETLHLNTEQKDGRILLRWYNEINPAV